jgi:hypothetical protein
VILRFSRPLIAAFFSRATRGGLGRLLPAGGHRCSPTTPQRKPRLTARPQGVNSGLALTTLDEKAAFALSQSAIGKQVGDFVLLDRQGRPVELSRYRGKPLLVTFIYTACFQVCPTITRNLQKAVDNTVSVMGADRFNVISIGFNQPFRLAGSAQGLRPAVRHHLPNWEFLSPAPAIVGDLTAISASATSPRGRLRPHQPGDTGRRQRAGSSARSMARSLPPKSSPNRSSS